MNWPFLFIVPCQHPSLWTSGMLYSSSWDYINISPHQGPHLKAKVHNGSFQWSSSVFHYPSPRSSWPSRVVEQPPEDELWCQLEIISWMDGALFYRMQLTFFNQWPTYGTVSPIVGIRGSVIEWGPHCSPLTKSITYSQMSVELIRMSATWGDGGLNIPQKTTSKGSARPWKLLKGKQGSNLS